MWLQSCDSQHGETKSGVKRKSEGPTVVPPLNRGSKRTSKFWRTRTGSSSFPCSPSFMPNFCNELLHVGNRALEQERRPVSAHHPENGGGQHPDGLRIGAGEDSKSPTARRRTLRSVRKSVVGWQFLEAMLAARSADFIATAIKSVRFQRVCLRSWWKMSTTSNVGPYMKDSTNFLFRLDPSILSAPRYCRRVTGFLS